MYGRARDPAGPHERLVEVATLDARGKPVVDFARSIDPWIEELIDEAGISCLLLCAPPRMLRALHAVLRPRYNVSVDQLAKDFADLTTHELGIALVAAGRLSAESFESLVS